ncbi:NUDIX hydrolase [Pseudoponticoccus marisrubri]|uniref:NUDIX hydrolase n=1 Tax=Pseudoponticoccus marisrubri TaxID=1685382 RepID=A0A0W7WQH0_9RHOB|nr:NUDIX hydrolase [Pseudoponticoccus marisrubri]KUF12843.1 NUDIX hydrolase [Pseudoponticoccus marisrubri]
MPEQGEQIAALPIRWQSKRSVQVLMVTSRGTGRWVMPKGWEMDGKKPWAAAAIEALEEAGAKGFVGHDLIGTYRYGKVLEDGTVLPCIVRVYPMVVEKLLRNWKERKERKRRWFSPKAAARKVDEPDLAELLTRLQDKPDKLPAIRRMLNALD